MTVSTVLGNDERDFRSFLLYKKEYSHHTIEQILSYDRLISCNTIDGDVFSSQYYECSSRQTKRKIRWVLYLRKEYQNYWVKNND
jgi:hypothetical protein